MSGVNKEEFLANEKASKDTIDVKRIYVDMAGDLVGGILLSQIVFWHLPNEKGNSKLRVFHKGEYWIARGREDYWEDCRVTAKQFDRAIKELESLNLVVTDVLKFNGSPMKHVRIDWDVFLASYENLLKSYGENGYSPKGKNQITQKVISLTESTSESKTAGESKTDSPPTAEKTPPVEKNIVPEKTTVREDSTSTDALFDAMHSESEGMPPLGELTAGVADPQAERMAFIDKYHIKVARLYCLEDDGVTARSVAAKLYDHRTVKRKRWMLDDAIEAVQREGLPPSPYMFVPAIVAKLEVKRSRSVIKVSA